MKKRIFLHILPLLILAGCVNDNEPLGNDGGISGLVFRTSLYTSGVLGTADKALVDDMNAYLFKDGKFAKAYERLTVDAEGHCEIYVPNKNTHLYFLANASSLFAGDALHPENMTEEEFLNSTYTATAWGDKGAIPFMSAWIDLSVLTTGKPDVTLERGYARLDLNVTGSFLLKAIRVDNMPSGAYLYRGHTATGTPENPDIPDAPGTPGAFEHTFDTPLEGSRSELCYLYEHSGDGIPVTLTAIVEGVETEIRATLPGSIRSNHVYTINVVKGASLNVTVAVSDWKIGDSTTATPDIESRVLVDTERSALASDLRVSATRDTIYIPYYGNDFTLGLAASSEIELTADAGTGITVTPLTDPAIPPVTPPSPTAPVALSSPVTRSLSTGNLFRVEILPRFPNDTGLQYLRLKARNKSLDNYYGDEIVLVQDPSRVMVSGTIEQYFNRSFTSRIPRYADGEIGQITVPADCEVTVDQPWLKVEPTGDGKYRLIGGYRPNDPEAKGDVQEGRFTVKNPNGKELAYTVSRLNLGLPVVLVNGTYWCEFNLRGNSKKYEDQIQIGEVTTADLYAYLKTCSSEDYVRLMGQGYMGSQTNGMSLVYDASGFRFYYAGYTSTVQGAIGNGSATAHCPDGYRVPSADDYKRLNKASGTITFTGDDIPVEYTSWGGPEAKVYRYTRKDVKISDIVPGNFYLQKYEIAGSSPLVIGGLGHQWAVRGYTTEMTLLANISGGINTWYIGAEIGYTANNENKTRHIRCIKTPVTYIY